MPAASLRPTLERMVDQEDVRRIALSLPGTSEDEDHFAFTVENKGKPKGFAWVWLERVTPKKARMPNPGVLAVRVRNEAEKAMLVAGDPDRFFTEPHYNGFPAVLVRLRAVTRAQIHKLLVDAWRCQAPRHLVDATGAAAAAAAAPPRRRRPSARR